jgi:hypothetical protein
MHRTMTLRGAALSAIGVAALLVILTLTLVGPAQAAPRTGITVARGLPAEAQAAPGGATFSTHPLRAASIAAPLTQSEDYGVVPWAAAWAIGAVGAVVLLGAARALGLAQGRSREGRPAELAASGPVAGRPEQSDEQPRKAA